MKMKGKHVPTAKFFLMGIAFNFLQITHFQTHTIHGTIVYLPTSHKNQPNVGKYTSPMDGIGMCRK